MSKEELEEEELEEKYLAVTYLSEELNKKELEEEDLEVEDDELDEELEEQLEEDKRERERELNHSVAELNPCCVLQEVLAGVVVIQSKSELQHQGITLATEGMVNMQLSAKSVGVFEAFYNSLKVCITRPATFISDNI